MGVRARLITRLGPGGVVELQQVAPGLEQREVSIAHSRVFEGAHQVPRKVIRRGVHAGRRIDALARHGDALEDAAHLLACRDVVQHREHVHVLAEDLAVTIVGEQPAPRIPAMLADRGCVRVSALDANDFACAASPWAASSAAPCRSAPTHIAVIRQLPFCLPQEGNVSRSSHFWPDQSMKFHCGFLPNKPCALSNGSNQLSTLRMRGRWRRISAASGCSQRPVRQHAHPGK